MKKFLVCCVLFAGLFCNSNAMKKQKLTFNDLFLGNGHEELWGEVIPYLTTDGKALFHLSHTNRALKNLINAHVHKYFGEQITLKKLYNIAPEIISIYLHMFERKDKINDDQDQFGYTDQETQKKYTHYPYYCEHQRAKQKNFMQHEKSLEN